MFNFLFSYLFDIICTLICLFFVRIFIVYLRVHKKKRLVTRNTCLDLKIMVVLGSGGHTFEMIRLLQNVGEKFRPRIYVCANSDEMSTKKIKLFEATKITKEPSIQSYSIETIPRSREVNQSWISTVLTTSYSFIHALKLVYEHKPEAILCNGPGTCVPICVTSFLLHVLGLKDSTIIYVESICRVKTMSLSGKIVYHLADQFLVQWPHLQKNYPRAKYIGKLI